IYAASRLLETVANSPVPLSQMLSDIPRTVVTPEIRIQCDDDKKFAVVEQVKSHFRKSRQVIEVDGARVLFPEGWGLVRASNTQDVLVLRFEAANQASLEAIRAEVEDEVSRAKTSGTTKN
ncbi:MAG TPA: phosphomannomutase, partial [Acidobacteriota bacterium]|nr:phosphomannomutase [Acidobacteriota bacterium]